MFLLSDTLRGRQVLIRSFTGGQATLGAVLAVIDFEWTIRRAIIALGYEPTKAVREDIEMCSGPSAYRKKWIKHVVPIRKKSIETIVPDWTALTETAFKMRHKIVHGVQVRAPESTAVEAREIALLASSEVCKFAEDLGFDLYKRLPIRRKLLDTGS
jgi:hypothetical protein